MALHPAVTACKDKPDFFPVTVARLLSHLEPEMNVTLLKKPSALLPLTCSLAAFSLTITRSSMYSGGDGSVDVISDKIFRYLLISEIPFIGYFAVRWLPSEWDDALRVLSLQVGAALTAILATVLLG